jgi:uncharacterized protein (TIGR02145 family)
MKINICLTSLIFISLLVISTACKNKENNKIPDLTTTNISLIAANSANGGGNITNSYSNLTGEGVCWSKSHLPTVDGNKTTNEIPTVSFASNINGLESNTTYYVRAYATNIAGTGYGNEVSFTTGPVEADIDGNVFHTINIGTQVWMLENLKTKHFRNGDPLSYVADSVDWISKSTEGYCYNNNDSSIALIYGNLYNWFAATDPRNISPIGWHVPSGPEYNVLVNNLGGYSTAGGKLKEDGFVHWLSPNTGATNETGFTGLPGGDREFGNFINNGSSAFFWSSTANTSVSLAYCLQLRYDNSYALTTPLEYQNGFSIRCVKD